jgi:hypothetical protein
METNSFMEKMTGMPLLRRLACAVSLRRMMRTSRFQMILLAATIADTGDGLGIPLIAAV